MKPLEVFPWLVTIAVVLFLVRYWPMVRFAWTYRNEIEAINEVVSGLQQTGVIR